MKTIFLAAGSSSRMAPIGDKNFLEFNGQPLMLHLLKNAQSAGCDDFVIVGNRENKEKIATLISENDFLKNTLIAIQTEDTGMAGGIKAALKYCDDESILVLNGNDFVEPAAIKEVITTGNKNDGALLVQVRETYFPGGYLKTDTDDKIISIIEKPGEGNEPSNLVNIVVHFFKKSQDLATTLQQSHSNNDDIYEVALDTLFKEKEFKVVKYSGASQAIKYPWHVLEMMDLLGSQKKNTIAKTAEISEKATIKGEGVIIADGVRVFENAVISGPCYVGENTVIGNGALVRNSSIGSDCVIGFNTEVARSWVNNGVTTHVAYIGDSVIDSAVNFGAYSCTANLRLDKKNIRVNIKEQRIDSGHKKLGAVVGHSAQIGVGAKLMPGAKVESSTHIRPNEVWF